MRVGRNEACPCGSGKKYKACCEGKNTRGMSPGLLLLLGAIGLIVAAGVVASIRSRKDDRPAPMASVPAPVRTPSPQPPGPAPAGKVWSPEHGHWHDQQPAAPATQPIQIQQPAGAPATAGVTPTPKPQPPGPAPAGKVWSPEHGHWHDVPKQ